MVALQNVSLFSQPNNRLVHVLSTGERFYQKLPVEACEAVGNIFKWSG